METTTIGLGNTTIRMEREMVDVTSNAPRPDPAWAYNDKRGHLHQWADGNTLPTLKWVVTGAYYCDLCRDDHEEGHYECIECGEKVEPGMRPASTARQMIPGMERYFINDEEVTKEEVEDLLNQIRGGTLDNAEGSA